MEKWTSVMFVSSGAFTRQIHQHQGWPRQQSQLDDHLITENEPNIWGRLQLLKSSGPQKLPHVKKHVCCYHERRSILFYRWSQATTMMFSGSSHIHPLSMDKTVFIVLMGFVGIGLYQPKPREWSKDKIAIYQRDRVPYSWYAWSTGHPTSLAISWIQRPGIWIH